MTYDPVASNTPAFYPSAFFTDVASVNATLTVRVMVGPKSDFS